MKNRKLILLPVLLMALSSCRSTPSKTSEQSQGGSSNPPAVSESTETPTSGESVVPSEPSEPAQPSEPSEPVQPSEPSEPARDPLAAPVLRLNNEKTGLTWDAVTDAVSYDIVVNDGEPQSVQAPGYTFSAEAGTYAVKVKAKADVATYDSAFSAVFNYETKLTAIGALSLSSAGNEIKMASLVGNGVEMKVDAGEFADATVNQLGIAITSGGLYTLHAKAGYDEANNINYVANPNEDLAKKAILVTMPAAAAKVILDGSEENYNGWAKEYYGTSWATSSTANIESSDANGDLTEGNCVKFTYHANGNAFRLRNSNVAFTGAYDTVSFDIKGDDIATVTLRLVIGGQLFHNVYADLSLGVVPGTWMHLDVPMADEDAWKINLGGTNYKFSDAAAKVELPYDETDNPLGANTKLVALGQLMPLFTEVDVILKNKGTAGSSTSNVYMDNLEFNNSHKNGLKVLEAPTLLDNYTYAATGARGTLNKVGEDRILTVGSQEVAVSAAIDPATNLLVMESTTAPYIFTLNALSYDGGWSFYAMDIQASEQVQAALEGFVATAGQLVDKFAYAATGEGYDTTHTLDQVVEGIRTAYFSDYNNGSTPSSNASPFGGTWALMGTSNYLYADSTEGHMGLGAAKLKITQKWMRYSTAGVLNGTATAWAKAQTFSIWVKNPNDAAVSDSYLRIFTKNNLAGNIEDGTLKVHTGSIPANSGWIEVKVNLDPTKTYYGFSLALGNTSALDGKYIYVDDACLYSAGINTAVLLAA